MFRAFRWLAAVTFRCTASIVSAATLPITREMGATAPASRAERGQPTFFMKPADAIVVGHGDHIPYPPGTKELHHEVELVVALGSDAPAGELPVEQAEALIYGYGVGLT